MSVHTVRSCDRQITHTHTINARRAKHSELHPPETIDAFRRTAIRTIDAQMDCEATLIDAREDAIHSLLDYMGARAQARQGTPSSAMAPAGSTSSRPSTCLSTSRRPKGSAIPANPYGGRTGTSAHGRSRSEGRRTSPTPQGPALQTPTDTSFQGGENGCIGCDSDYHCKVACSFVDAGFDYDFLLYDDSESMFAVTQASKIPNKKKAAKNFVKTRLGAKAVKAFERSASIEGKLNNNNCTTFRAVSARANYLASRRPEGSYSCKELCREFAAPNDLSVGKQFYLVPRTTTGSPPGRRFQIVQCFAAHGVSDPGATAWWDKLRPQISHSHRFQWIAINLMHRNANTFALQWVNVSNTHFHTHEDRLHACAFCCLSTV